MDFPHAHQIFAIRRQRHCKKTRTQSEETVYGITSLSEDQADAQRLATLVRKHWGIENKLHYRRDWTFDEDRCRIRKPNGARIMASLRAVPIAAYENGLLKCRHKRPVSMPSMLRWLARNPHAAINLVTNLCRVNALQTSG